MVLDASVVAYIFPPLVCVVGVAVLLVFVCVKLETCGEGEMHFVVAVLDALFSVRLFNSGRVRLIRKRTRKWLCDEIGYIHIYTVLYLSGAYDLTQKEKMTKV